MNDRVKASDTTTGAPATSSDPSLDFSNASADFTKSSSRDQRAARLSMLLLAMVGAGSQAAHADTPISYGGPADLSITPEVPSVQVGTQVVADVGFTGLQNSLIGGYDLTIDYDPTLLAVNTVSFGTYLDGPDSSIQLVNQSQGSIEFYEYSFGSLSSQSGYGALPLFDITFDTLAAGTSALTFDTVANAGVLVSDQEGNNFTNFVTVDSSVTITGATTVEAPEIDPGAAGSAITLFVGGVLVSVGRRQRVRVG